MALPLGRAIFVGGLNPDEGVLLHCELQRAAAGNAHAWDLLHHFNIKTPHGFSGWLSRL